MTSGLQLFVRYAYPPNERGYCGPADHRELFDYGAAGVNDPGLARLARAFHGPWPYLKLMSEVTGIADPFDRRLVEAYWVGNRILDRIDARRFGDALQARFRPQVGSRWPQMAEAITAGVVPHHSFHVFGVYPWVGLLDSGRGEPLDILEQCRIRWGRVVESSGDRAVVRYRPLTWDGSLLGLGAPVVGAFTQGLGGRRLVGALQPGDWVSLHWNWVCDRLTDRQLGALRRYSRRQLEITNTKLRHPGPAMVMG